MNEYHAVATQPLEDEALAAEEARPQLLVEGDTHLGAQCSTQERVLLADQLSVRVVQVDGDDRPRIGRPEGHVLLALPCPVGEVGDEQRLAGDHPLPNAHQLVQEASLGPGAISHLGLKADAVLHVHHRPGFGDHRLAGVQLDLHELQVVAENLVIDRVAIHGFTLLCVSACAHPNEILSTCRRANELYSATLSGSRQGMG